MVQTPPDGTNKTAKARRSGARGGGTKYHAETDSTPHLSDPKKTGNHVDTATAQIVVMGCAFIALLPFINWLEKKQKGD